MINNYCTTQFNQNCPNLRLFRLALEKTRSSSSSFKETVLPKISALAILARLSDASCPNCGTLPLAMDLSTDVDAAVGKLAKIKLSGRGFEFGLSASRWSRKGSSKRDPLRREMALLATEAAPPGALDRPENSERSGSTGEAVDRLGGWL